ncbi:MAG: ABC transporter ATP-binding protein [Planctomycetes bacterium]|nr:ABC transporter ATP-binding protein [Planctomycetota bacterium]
MLEVRGLRYAYGERLAVRSAALQVERGEVFGLLGPNGAGKTTLLSCVAGLLGRFGGELLFAGAPFRPAADDGQRALVGLVPQELALYEELDARENLALFAALQGVPRERVGLAIDAALQLAGLAERARDRVKTYSGGMKRRLNLAIGDLHEPPLLLLDEPTVGVDPQSRNHVFECLGQLQQKGRTVIYTTHYMEEAQRLCDRVAVMHEGTVLAAGTAAELAERAGVPGADLETVFLRLTGKALRDEP